MTKFFLSRKTAREKEEEEKQFKLNVTLLGVLVPTVYGVRSLFKAFCQKASILFFVLFLFVLLFAFLFVFFFLAFCFLFLFLSLVSYRLLLWFHILLFLF